MSKNFCIFGANTTKFITVWTKMTMELAQQWKSLDTFANESQRFLEFSEKSLKIDLGRSTAKFIPARCKFLQWSWYRCKWWYFWKRSKFFYRVNRAVKRDTIWVLPLFGYLTTLWISSILRYSIEVFENLILKAY